MKRVGLAVVASVVMAATLGVGSALARADSTLTETCSNGTVTVHTTVDASSVNPGNFEIGSSNFAGKTPLGYECVIA